MIKLTKVFEHYGVTEREHQLRIAYILASFMCLHIKDEDSEEDDTICVDADDITCYELEDMLVSEYDLEAGAYHNGVWLSMKAIIRALVNFEERIGY